MVYDSDFYTTRRYRPSPSVSSYTISSAPSRQVRVLPGLGKVHIVHTYDRIVPYVGHKRLTVVTVPPPRVFSTRPSILHKEYERIENKVRPWVGYSPTSRYLNSDSAVRTYYINYPISGTYYTTYNRTSSEYYPKIYRWYYDWPRLYSYWPYFRSLWKHYYNYTPLYRSSSLDYSDFWSSYYNSYWYVYRYLRPFVRNLDTNFRELESQIDNLKRMIYVSNPISQQYYPDSSLQNAKVYRPLNLYYDYYYPTKSLNLYADHWPNYDHLLYRYTYPSDRYYFLKGKIMYYTRQFTPDHFERYKHFDPLSLHDFSSKFRNSSSSFWPKFRSLSEFVNDLPLEKAIKIQNIFDGETRLIRAQTASLLKKIHAPVVRQQRPLPITTVIRYDPHDGVPARLSNDNYIYRLLTTSPRNPKVEYTTYYSEPVRKYIGSGRLACVSYAGDRSYNRRNHFFLYEDPLKSDIQLLSYYINRFRQEKKAIQSSSDKVPLSPLRPSRVFSKPKLLDDSATEEIKELREARAARLAHIYAESPKEKSSSDVDEAVKAKKKKEEARLAEEKALAEEQTRKAALAKKEEAARKAELARQEELAAQAAAERAAELEKQAELTRQQELAKQAAIEKAKKEEEERAKAEEQKRLEEEARAEEERKQLLRLEELARQAEEEREAELARQAEELAELARQEAELAEQAKKQAELEEQARLQAEQEELAKQQAELEELERQEKELVELAKKEAEVAEQAQKDAELAQQEAELAELERQQAELDALEAEAKKLEEETPVEDAPVAEEEPTAPEEVAVAEEEASTVAEDEETVEEPTKEETVLEPATEEEQQPEEE